MSKARNPVKRRHPQKPRKPPTRRREDALPEATTQDASQDESDRIEYTPLSGCLCRFFWMLLGNVFLGFTAYAIAIDHDRVVSGKDVFFGLLVASLVATRYVDIRYLNGLTTDGGRATMEHWRRYSLQLALAAAALWLVVHAFAYFAG